MRQTTIIKWIARIVFLIAMVVIFQSIFLCSLISIRNLCDDSVTSQLFASIIVAGFSFIFVNAKTEQEDIEDVAKEEILLEQKEQRQYNFRKQVERKKKELKGDE